MNTHMEPASERLEQVVDTFWEHLPPFWQRIRAHIRQAAAEQFDLSVEQFHILRHIRRGQDTVSELAEARNISRAAISQAVEVLVQRGLVTRTTDLLDRRHLRLALTASGGALLDTIFDDTRQWMMQILSPLSDEELESLARGLATLQKIQAV
jgi:DNA-binding MarR family transcriptional regulator